jgi:hypothetical protein
MDETDVPGHQPGMFLFCRQRANCLARYGNSCLFAADTNVTKIRYLKQVARSTLTRNKFRRIFSGSEAVVAGRQISENFTSEVKGQSLSGNSSYCFIPTTLPPADTNETASSMERLWAYLTIQQLLEKQDASTDGDVNDNHFYDEADDDGDRSNTDVLTLALRVSTSFRILAVSREMGLG